MLYDKSKIYVLLKKYVHESGNRLTQSLSSLEKSQQRVFFIDFSLTHMNRILRYILIYI